MESGDSRRIPRGERIRRQRLLHAARREAATLASAAGGRGVSPAGLGNVHGGEGLVAGEGLGQEQESKRARCRVSL